MVHGASVVLSCLSCRTIKHRRHHGRTTLSLRTELVVAVVVSVKIRLTISYALLLIIVFSLMVVIVASIVRRGHIFFFQRDKAVVYLQMKEKKRCGRMQWGRCYLCVQMVCYCYSLRLKKATAKVVYGCRTMMDYQVIHESFVSSACIFF